MKNEATICVVISLYNGEKLLHDCIKSARLLTNNVVVIDTESKDNTAGVAKKLGTTVFSYPWDPIIEPSRNFAMKQADADWVYILDADERISPGLADEIKKIIQTTTYTYFSGPRLNMFAEKWPLKHGGWWPDPIIRLIKKSAFVTWPEIIHSTPVIKGEKGELKIPLHHLSQGNLSEMVGKTVRFEDKEAELLSNAGRRANTIIFFRKYIAELYRRLLKKMGILDGVAGLIAGVYQGFSKTITYLLVYEKNEKKQ